MSQSSDLPPWADLMTEGEEGSVDADDWEVKPVSYGDRTVGKAAGGAAAGGDLADHWPDHSGDFWENAHQLGQDYLNRGLSYASVAAGRDPGVDHELLEKTWNQGIEVVGRIWEKVEPLLAEYVPEDRNPFWVCGAVFLVLLIAVAGLQVDFKHNSGAPKAVNLPPIKSPHVKLPDGRRLAYNEQGVSHGFARHTMLVAHGFPSSRLAGIPGIKSSLLQEFGVRLISYDRPGFGESDVHPRMTLQTSAKDMAYIADALGAGEKFWVLGYSTGGIHVWAAMKYIPERLSGVALFAPGGNFYAPNMSKHESNKVWEGMTLRRRLLYMVARWIPSLLPSILKGIFIKQIDKLHNAFMAFGGKDQELMQHRIFWEALTRDIEESTRQRNPSTLAHEFGLQVRPWGFHLSDFRVRKKVPPSGFLRLMTGFWNKEEDVWEGFSAPIHIWQGSEDQIVPFPINEFARRMVPQTILHKLEGEGHYSYFWYCERCHREIFTTLFSNKESTKMTESEDATHNAQRDYP